MFFFHFLHGATLSTSNGTANDQREVVHTDSWVLPSELLDSFMSGRKTLGPAEPR